jgi:outer membrane protein assembly factor BamB
MRSALLWSLSVTLLLIVQCTKPSATEETSSTSRSGQQLVHHRADEGRTGSFSFPAIRQQPKQKWKVHPGPSNLGTPLVSGGILYSGGSDGLLYALDSASGKTIWSKGDFELIENATAIVGDVIVGGGLNKAVRALNRRDGKQLWSFEASAFVFTAPLVADGKVYVATYEKLHALELKTGRRVWEVDLGSQPAFVSSPAFEEGTIYVTVGPQLCAFDSSNGKERWRVKSKSQFWGLAVAHQLVYVGNSDGYFYAYDQKTSQQRWKFKSGYSMQDDIWSAPAIANERVYAGSRDQWLYALNAHTGEKVWGFKTSGDSIGECVLSDGVAYFSDSNHTLPLGSRRLYALDAASGHELWNFETTSTILTTPALEKGRIFVTIEDGVIALE